MMIEKFNLLIAAPHFLYPPQGGNDILIWERYTKLEKHKNCILLGAEEILFIKNGNIYKKEKYNSSKFYGKFSKYFESFQVLFFKKNYLFCKYINKKFIRKLKNLEHKYLPDNIILSHTYTLIALNNLKLLRSNTNYICETHNNDWEWFNNLKKRNQKYTFNYKNIMSNFFNIFFNKICSNSIEWLDNNFKSIPPYINFSFLSRIDQFKIVEKVPFNKNFVLAPQIPEFFLNEKKYLNNKKSLKSKINLLFIGSLQISQNNDSLRYFADEFFPIIKINFPNVNVHVAGRKPNREIKKLCLSNNWQMHIDITNNKLRSLYRKSDFMILPFKYSNGFKIKFIESLANGTPILGTNSVAYLSEDTKIPLSLFSDSPSDWVQHIDKVTRKDKIIINRERNKIISISKKWHPRFIIQKIEKHLK